MRKAHFGVYRTDCYKMSQADKEKMFLKAFVDYGDALRYAQRYSKTTAIHLC